MSVSITADRLTGENVKQATSRVTYIYLTIFYIFGTSLGVTHIRTVRRKKRGEKKKEKKRKRKSKIE